MSIVLGIKKFKVAYVVGGALGHGLDLSPAVDVSTGRVREVVNSGGIGRRLHECLEIHVAGTEREVG